MPCISPITLRQGKSLNSFPCGKCNFCLQDRRADWTFRLSQELKSSVSAYFLTLTYSEESQYPVNKDGQPQLDKTDLQKFIKRLRKANDSEPNPINPFELERTTSWPKIKYYAVGEYGTHTFRPHYHLIIFNVKPSVLSKIQSLWPQGFTAVGNAEPASIHYTTKYVLNKKDGWEGINKPFALISQGIGKRYLHTNGHEHKKALKAYVVNDQSKQRLPRYYSDKIFSRRDKEELRKQSINQNDLLHQKNVERVKDFHPQPETYLEYCQRQAHEKIEERLKTKNPDQI